jgi:glutamate-1-semialdehyde 2,1-aminomutase
MMQWQRSQTLFDRAKQSLAGGVNSNLRLLTKPVPLFFDRAEGAIVYDVDGNAYIDYNLGQGPMILGHSHPAVIEAVNQAMRRGQLYAAQHELEIIVAEKMVALIPCAELCRFGLSGSDMVQAAMRLARAVTGRKKILRFEGHYHGWLDTLALQMPQTVEQAGALE